MSNDEAIMCLYIRISFIDLSFYRFFSEERINLFHDFFCIVKKLRQNGPKYFVCVVVCFNGSSHVLCTRHLKQNANKYMEDIVGMHLKARINIINVIFGSDSLNSRYRHV